MKFEFSAGGVVFRRKTKNEKQTNFEILVAQHSQHHGWVFPKGIIDKGEKKEETALREVQEETGVIGKIIQPLQPVTYWYNFEGDPSTSHSTVSSDRIGSGQVKIKKTVYYFLMEFVSGDTKNHDWEMENVEWIQKEEVEEKLTYKSDKDVWTEAEQRLENSK